MILRALHDPAAREELGVLAEHDDEARVRARARAALRALIDQPAETPTATLDVALAAAARLHAAHLYFEVHELLEPFWGEARADAREALQGLIQVAVGFQHLANGNLAGARALLVEGSARLTGRRLAGRDLDPYARQVAAVARGLPAIDWDAVPPFPGRAGG